ncbi:MAG: MATE family efflux transporter [Selenomonadaceae bacterium]|nr:MATE family efflux transporter [Selenomonadaceae bacterium]
MRHTLSYGDKWREFANVALPIFVAQVAIIATSFFNTVMAGHLGEEDLAGVALGVNLFLPFFTSFMGIISALTPIIAGYYGAGKYRDIGYQTGQGIYWAILLSFLFVGAGYVFVPKILPHLSLAPEVETITRDYLFFLSFGIPFFFVFAVLKNLIDSHGYTKLTMGITIFTVPVNIGLNYVFMYGAYGFPKLGGAGAGIGSAATFIITFLVTAQLVMYMNPFAKYKIFMKLPLPSFRIWLRHLKVGLPIGGTIFCENSIFGVVGILMTAYGTSIIAAHQVNMNFTTLMYMVPFSVSMSLAILVGYEIGAGREKDARAYIKIGRIFAAAFIGMLTVTALQFREEIAAVYTSSPNVLKILPTFLVYGAFMQVADSLNAPIQGALRGYKDVNATFLLAVLSYWAIGLPTGYVLANYTDFQYYGYWVGLITGVLCGAALLSLRLKTVQKKR